MKNVLNWGGLPERFVLFLQVTSIMTLDDITELFLHRKPLPSLVPKGVWRNELIAEIEGMAAPPLVKAGLHLWNDDIDRCHSIAQAHATPEGNYWHAILHRREPDYSNSKYWYRRVGEHAIFSDLRATWPEWDPLAFVDWCQATARGTNGKPREWLEEIQAREMERLLAFVSAGDPTSKGEVHG